MIGAGEQRKRERNPKRLGSFEVKYQLDLDGLLDRQISRFVTFKPNCWVLLHQFARCRDGEAVLFGPAIDPGVFAPGRDFAPNDVDVTAQIV
jgi:hypothetical protein